MLMYLLQFIRFLSSVSLVPFNSDNLFPRFCSITFLRPGHDVKLHPHFHCHWKLFVLMCDEAGQSAFLHTQLYLSTYLNHILFSNVS